MDINQVKCSVFIATSLDGFIARENGEIDWLLNPGPPGEKTEPEEAKAEDGDYNFQAFFDSVDALVTGRNTYESVLGFKEWPYGDKKVVVLSTRGIVLPPHLAGKVEVMNASPLEVLEDLASRGHRHLYVDGGRTIQGFLRAGVPLEMTITTLPVLLGQGIPLFGPLERDIHLRHLDNQVFSNGMVQDKYQVWA